MGKHGDFNIRVKILKDAWWEQGLTSYNFLYEKFSGRDGYYLVCPNLYATSVDYHRHGQSPTYRLHYYFWMNLRKYFERQTIGAQRYLIKKHNMVKRP